MIDALAHDEGDSFDRRATADQGAEPAARWATSAPIRLDTLFAAQAARTPKQPAILHRGAVVDYRTLDDRSNRLARHLRAAGARAGTVVGVQLERTPDLIVSLLAVLKAGAAYLPLDPNYPADRLAFMLRDSSAQMLITRTAQHPATFAAGMTIDLDRDAAAITAHSSARLSAAGTAADPAYIIYTSGSSGQPKGVMLAHTAVHLVEWAKRSFTSEELARVAATTSICFDPSVFEIFVPLCTGGMVILKDSVLEPFSADECPTMLQGVPSILAEVARAATIPASLKVINSGGEVLTAELVQDLHRATQGARIFNHYGPTEATTCTSVALVEPCGSAPTIGRPICGARIHILREDGRPAEPGALGEIHIAGPTLAIGYVGQPELTEARFLPNPFCATGTRMYRTGDMGRVTEAGDVEFLGRVDDQVKLRGFRVELAEVEAALIGLPAVRQAVALVQPSVLGRDQLVAYICSDATFSLDEVRRDLADTLPAYMLPSALVQVSSFPLTMSGKIDRKALCAPSIDDQATAPASSDTLSHETVVAGLFADLLGRAAVGADENFFEIGGDSLLAVEAALRLESLLNLRISPALLMHSPTPRLLVASLADHMAEEERGIWKLQPHGNRPPLFCPPGIDARVNSFLSLSRHLGPDQPLFALRPGPLAQATSLRELARHYVELIRRLQPTGPYAVCGYSFSGVLAHELACALEADGEQVHLVLLDSPIRRQLPGLRGMAISAVEVAQSAFRQGGLGAVLPRFRRMRWSRLRRAPSADVELPEWLLPEDVPYAQALLRAVETHDYPCFRGAVTMVGCTQRPAINALLDSDGMLGWRGLLTGKVSRIPADVDHAGLMREPYVAELSQTILKALR
jgi:amino acid adenylation domain-containing protein